MRRQRNLVLLIHNLYLSDSEFEQLQSAKHTNFTTNTSAWYNYEEDHYSLENPSKRLQLFLGLHGYEYTQDDASQGWSSVVATAMKSD